MSTDTFAPLSFPTLGGTPGLIEEQARTRGHASGYAAGMRAAEETLRAQRAAAAAEHAALMAATRQRAEALAALLGAAVEAAHSRVTPVVQEAQDAIAHAAIELAEAIIGVELADGPTSARAAVTRALRHTDPAGVLAVRMHPATLAALDDAALSDAALRGAAHVDGLTYIADASLAPGDAIADFADGHLDAQIASAVARAKAALLDPPA